MTVTKLLTDDVRRIASAWLEDRLPEQPVIKVTLGLPEWDDRLLLWRVALVPDNDPSQALGEIQVDQEGLVHRAPVPAMVLERLGQIRNRRQGHRDRGKADITFPSIPSKAILGDCRVVLGEFPPNSVQLVFTSPPYFNAKPECAEYIDYSSYLSFLGEAFAACHSVLAEGRFLIVNVSPVLVRRTSRSTASKRLPIPFDLHPILVDQLLCYDG